MAPFLAASLSAAVAALILGPTAGAGGRALPGLAALLALVSSGPHEVLDPAFPPTRLAVVAAAAALWDAQPARRGRAA